MSWRYLQIPLLLAALGADPQIQYDRVPAPQVAPVKPAPVEPEVPVAVRRLYVFGYDACVPCRSSRPQLDAWLKTAGLPVQTPTPHSECVYIDVVKYPQLAEQWSVSDCPAVIVSDDLKPVARHVGAYTVEDLQRLWETGRSGGHVAAAFAAAAAGTSYTLPRVSIDPTTKAITILETVDIPYGNFLTATLQKDCVITVATDGQCTFSQPYPRFRTRPIRWDGYLQRMKVDMTARTAVLEISGFGAQTIHF